MRGSVRRGRRRRSGALGAIGALAGAIALLVASPALAAPAAPTPGSGPTAGGTATSGTVGAVAFESVWGGVLHSLAIGSDGRTYGWGENSDGQLGDGTTTASSRPVAVQTPPGVTFVAVSGGGQHSLALTADGRAYAWGDNSHRQLGDGTATSSGLPVAVQLPAGVTFTRVAAGNEHSLALGSDGRVYAWGDNSHGQLGDGTTTASGIPVAVQTPPGVTFTAIATGAFHSLAVGSDGVTYAWGQNDVGQLGIGDETDASEPTPVPAPAGVSFTAVAAGDYSSAAVGSDGRAYTWGNNDLGQLGTGTFAGSTVPVPASTPAGATIATVSLTAEFVLALATDGTLYAWGDNYGGQLGDGSEDTSPVPLEVAMPAGVTVASASAGGYHSLAIGTDGQTYTWGWNSLGQVGNGTNDDVLTPAVITGATVDAVLFGGTAGTSLSQAGATWMVTTSAHACGPADVEVRFTQFGAPGSQTFPAGFVFGTAPAVLTQPASATVTAGSVFRAEAAASGDDVPAVRWQRSADGGTTWTDVPGATDTALAVTPAETTSYRAVFANCLGTAVSEAAVATVTAAGPGGGGNGGGGNGGGSGSGHGSGSTGPLAATGSSVSAAVLPGALAAVAVGTGLLLLIARRRRTAGR